jgi:ATP-dependent RNA helicase DeaD
MKNQKSFSQLGFKKNIVEALSSAGIKNATEVQEQIIPKIQSGGHVVFTSQTGSGKTLCFLLGYLPKINLKIGLQMLIITPTKELAKQVGKEISKICEKIGLKVGVLYGGRDFKGDMRTVKSKNQIIVATPGRLIEHINKKTLRVGDVKCIVYDESDQMFDNGFASDCAYIKRRCAKDVQVVLSSATITEKVELFIENRLEDYELVVVGDRIPKNIVQEKVYCKITDKRKLLIKCLEKLFGVKKKKQVIIFTNTKEKCFLIHQNLEKHKFHATEMHGDFKLKERMGHLNGFTSGRVPILITTNVAARGLHIPKIDAVINYDVSERPEFYVHRIGRTGRILKSGKPGRGYAITFICDEDVDRFLRIEEMFKAKVAEVDMDFDRI